MKNLTVIFMLILLGACQSNKQISKTIPGETTSYFLDFQPFLKKGFVFSTGDINQKYVPIGIFSQVAAPDIINVFTPSYSPVNPKEFEKGLAISENGDDYVLTKSIPSQKADISELLQKVYESATSKGANGMINMKYNKNSKEELEISGTLVKIEN